MIAVAKSLLGGLESTASSATKKDGNGPPFADTFQQVSSNQTDQANKLVTQRVPRNARASSSMRKEVESPSSVDSVEQAVIGSDGRPDSEAKTDENTATSVTATAGKRAATSAVRQNVGGAEVTGGQTGADVETQLKTATNNPVRRFVFGVRTQEDVADVMKNRSLSGSTDSAIMATFQRAEKSGPIVAANMTQSADLLFSSKEKASKPESKIALATSFETTRTFAAIAPGNALQAKPINPFEAVKETSTRSRLASTDTESFVKASEVLAGATSGGTLSGATSAPATKSQPEKNDPRGLEPVTQNLPAPRTPASIPSPAFAQSTKNSFIQAITKTPSRDANENAQTRTSGVVGFSANDQSAPIDLAGSTSLGIAAQAPLQTGTQRIATSEAMGVVTSGRVTDGGASYSGATEATLNRRIARDPEGDTDVTAAKGANHATSKRAGGTGKEVSIDARAESGLAPSIAVATDPSASSIANAIRVASVDNPTPSAGSISAATPVVSARALVSGVRQVGQLVASSVTPEGNAQGSITSVATEGGPAVKDSPTNGGHDGGPIQDANKPSGEAVPEPASGASTIVPSAASTKSGIADGSPNEKAVLAAANSLVKAGQSQGVTSGNTPVAKERKATTAEAKPVAASVMATLIESGPASPANHASTIASASTKPDSGAHQVAATSSGQLEAIPVASLGGSVQLSHPQVPVAAPSNAVGQVASTPVNAESLHLAANGASTSSVANLQGSDHGLSPMAHTTLSATPTVLEVGVPSGTQGWLKIRAEIGEGGVVQASVSASNHSDQDALRRDLPAMTAFLESEHVPVNLQVVHGTSANGVSLADGSRLSQDGGFHLGSGLGQGLSQDADSSTGSGQGQPALGMSAGGSGSQQNESQRGEANRRTASDAGTGAEPTRDRLIAADADWSATSRYGSGSSTNGGSWLNVIA